jgi:glycosyltransferase involved in cell wall biosynthesis
MPRAEIDRRGLRNVVTSLGRLTHRDMPALMREAHVVVLPSYMSGEMFPICLIEGMALGLPAIATRYSGIPEIVEHGETGILVEPRDADALADAIEHFLIYSEMRQKALARFRAHFSSGAVANAYLEHYQQALNGGTDI